MFFGFYVYIMKCIFIPVLFDRVARIAFLGTIYSNSPFFELVLPSKVLFGLIYYWPKVWTFSDILRKYYIFVSI